MSNFKIQEGDRSFLPPFRRPWFQSTLP